MKRISWGLLLFLLEGCWRPQEFLASKTTVEPHFIRAGFREDNLTIAAPILVEQRKTTGYRSVLELRGDIRVTKSLTNPSLVPPNGFILSLKYRW